MFCLQNKKEEMGITIQKEFDAPIPGHQTLYILESTKFILAVSTTFP